MKNRILYIVAIVALIATSCTEKGGGADIDTKPVTINFLAQLEQQTKSGYLDQNNNGAGGFAVGDVIGVFGYQKEGSALWANNELPHLMHNITLTKQLFEDKSVGVINYVYNPQRMWPDLPNKARFFAYYPHSTSVATGAVTPSPETHSGYPYVEVALGVTDAQLDFVTAQTNLMDKTAGTAADGVKFTFKHQLSQLFFKVKASKLTTGLELGDTRKMYINQLAIKNISNKAKYTFDDEPTSGAWTEHSTSEMDATSGATMISNSTIAEVGETYQDLIDPHGSGSYLLMIPQECDNVEIEVIYTVERLNPAGGCEDRVITIKQFPTSVNWKSGKTYTYSLDFDFLDINEAAIKLSLSVKDWVSGGYKVEMGK